MNDAPAVRPLHLPPEFRHAWLVLTVFGTINLVVLWRNLRGRIAQRPDLAQGYRRYFLAAAIFFTLPWLLMGVGIEVGGVPNLFGFLSLRDRNPYVIAFYATLTVMLLLACYWVLLRRGAEFLVEHPGLSGRNMPQSTAGIRVFRALMLAFWFVMLTLRWLNLLPVPSIR